TIATFGDTVHTFVQRQGYSGVFHPFYHPLEGQQPARSLGLTEIDHLGISIEAGTLQTWVEYYRQVFGFLLVHQEHVVTANSAMHSSVVQDPSGTVKFPMQEPAPARGMSQIEEFLGAYHGSGVQHLALSTQDILTTIRALRKSGIEFLSTPDSYYNYEMLESRVGSIEEDINELRRQHILVDRDEWGYLLQIFSKPVQSRPTLFLEVIQRRDARGFGSGNIRALFEAVERDQALRGNL
ncbi:MAG: 4-hydroxyphenylpyruvate dioxygenase, partial [Ktedonobacteraceae bacterium]